MGAAQPVGGQRPAVGDTEPTVSQQDLETMRRLFESVSEDDVSVWFQAADADIRVYPRSDEPGAADEYRGLDGLMDYLVNWFSQWDVYEFEPIEMFDAGHQVLVVARERGRVESTGMDVVEDFWHSFVLGGGRVAGWRMYDSRAEAFEAVGLRKYPPAASAPALALDRRPP